MTVCGRHWRELVCSTTPSATPGGTIYKSALLSVLASRARSRCGFFGMLLANGLVWPGYPNENTGSDSAKRWRCTFSALGRNESHSPPRVIKTNDEASDALHKPCCEAANFSLRRGVGSENKRLSHPVWVISGHRGTSARRPVYPRKRTLWNSRTHSLTEKEEGRLGTRI